ncbi:MAG: DUF4112 domain-containing protein [Afipia sp.]|nr:DUF4112 domain-containing protein [Afipia sp.]
MTDDSLFERTTRRPGARRPPVIDQDGNEVRPGRDFGGGSGASGVDFESAEFQSLSGALGGFSFAPLTREQRLARIDAVAKLMDVAFVLPRTKVRYGLDGIIGLVPIVGDLLAAMVSLWIVREARALGAPRYLIARMLGNVAVDTVVGFVPLAGDAFDVAFRSNIRNVRMLQRWLDKQDKRRREGRGRSGAA